MAIRFITGVPGGGKTYYAVKHLVETYFDFHTERQEYVLKSDHENLTIITNIEGFDLDHINLNDAMKMARTDIKRFFTVPYQEKLLKKYPKIVYIIDEAQQFFGRRFNDNNVFYFFEYHRHLGLDIYLITQNRYKIAKDITSLIELEYRAVKRSLSFSGELKYLIMSEGQIIDRKMIRPKKRIYKLYKSMTAKETEKIKNPLIKYLVVILILMAGSVYGFKRTFLTANSKADTEKKSQEQPQARQSVKKSYMGQMELKKGDLKSLPASYYIQGDTIFIYDPVSNTILPAEEYPHKIRIKRFQRRLYITVHVPSHLLPKETPKQREEESWFPGSDQET